MEDKIIYKGGWQDADTILQKLRGPIGDGQVWYPNGDHFKGVFNLSYQSIWNTAYTAVGRYTFADGSYIEDAWIITDSSKSVFSLKGLFRVKHPNGPDSIALFNNHRNGIELFLDKDRPYIKEWYNSEELHREHPLELVSFNLDDSKGDECLELAMTLRGEDGIYQVVQQGGRRYKNDWDNMIYEPNAFLSVVYPNGDSVDDRYGYGLKLLKPYGFYVDVHCAATAQWRTECWKDGRLEEAPEWKRDVRAAKCVELPNPWGGTNTHEANVWADGHIEYRWLAVYDGAVVNDRPEGWGVLVHADNDGTRYEGEFHEGRLHGKGVYDCPELGIHQEGVWVNGVFQEENPATEPITLHARHGHQSWSVGGSGDWEYEESDVVVELGRLGVFIGFGSLKVERIEKNCITLSYHGSETHLLTPGDTLRFYAEIEGREWSDGCVYDGDDYSLVITWQK